MGWVMQRFDEDGTERRRPIAIARPARANAEFVDIATLSLGGLALTFFLIAQYVGSSVLMQMFAL